MCLHPDPQPRGRSPALRSGFPLERLVRAACGGNQRWSVAQLRIRAAAGGANNEYTEIFLYIQILIQFQKIAGML